MSYSIILPVLIVVNIQQMQCEFRESDTCGFEGNSDFYGLGIRLGVYLQWLSSLVAAIWVPSLSDFTAAANMVFCLALFIAMLAVTFHSQCTYAVEIMVVPYMLWGGSIATVFPAHVTRSGS